MSRPRSILYVIDSQSGCWEWQGAISWNGYARIKRNGKLQWAHRWYYEQTKGPIPSGMDLDHLCRNTRCVNPDHLEPVTKAENQRRGLSVRLSWEAIEFIRSHYQPYHPEYNQYTLAKMFNVSRRAIQKVIQNKSWIEESEQTGGQ
jgi:hypothetical protein